MGLRTGIKRLDNDDLIEIAIRVYMITLLMCPEAFLRDRKARRGELLVYGHTFFPAYLPRVMIATRPTLRTV